jgi:RNA polymerase sigma-70 factor (ECF subfamily)
MHGQDESCTRHSGLITQFIRHYRSVVESHHGSGTPCESLLHLKEVELPDDPKFVERLRRGDKEACAICVREHSTHIYNLALKLTGDPVAAEDVLQETFLSAFKAIPRFEGKAQLSTWLYRIAHNAALMRLRKRQVETVSLDEPVENEEGVPEPREFADWSESPEEALLDTELQQVMDAAVQSLSETLRSVFVLRDVNGLSTAQTAEVLGLSEEAVKSRLLRARLALRERLTAYMSECVPHAETR